MSRRPSVHACFAPCNRLSSHSRYSTSAKDAGFGFVQTFSNSDTARKAVSEISNFVGDASVTSQPVFDPVVNVPALSSFLVIAVLFSFLQFRINGIGQAVTRRKTALEDLRKLKSKELSSEGENKPSPEMLVAATKEYESAVMEEENWRTVIPGVRLVAPNALESSQEDVEAAKRFLGLELEPQEKKEPTLESAGVGLSNTAKLVLALVALSQVALLYILSFDPMTVGNTFTSISGSTPPPDIPLSSW